MKSKNLSLVMALVLGVVFGACGGHDGIDPTTTMTKAEAQAFNSADWGYDVCEQNGWYNDGVCDEFCPLPDPDCQEPEGVHKPVCKWIGSWSEGWYWEDTNELIKNELCGSMSDPECEAIGSWSEGWYTDAGLIIWDICHRTVRIALEGEACGGSIGYSCHDGLYCQGLPVPGDGMIGGSGVCRLMGTCETTPDCSVEDNEWNRPMCVGYASCEDGQCVWHCDGNPECVDDSDCEYKQEWCEEGECVPCSNAGLYCTLYCEHGFVNRNGCIPCVCAEPSLHKPVCEWIGSYSEGWYWEDTNELIKYEICGSMSDPECSAIGSRSEGWYTDSGLIVWDMGCHLTVQ